MTLLINLFLFNVVSFEICGNTVFGSVIAGFPKKAFDYSILKVKVVVQSITGILSRTIFLQIAVEFGASLLRVVLKLIDPLLQVCSFRYEEILK
jgi:hypothetical protein